MGFRSRGIIVYGAFSVIYGPLLAFISGVVEFRKSGRAEDVWKHHPRLQFSGERAFALCRIVIIFPFPLGFTLVNLAVVRLCLFCL